MTAQLERLSPVRHAIITLGVILGMLMQLLDMTIANVALPRIGQPWSDTGHGRLGTGFLYRRRDRDADHRLAL